MEGKRRYIGKYKGFKPWGKPGWPGHPEFEAEKLRALEALKKAKKKDEENDEETEVSPREDDSGGGEVPEPSRPVD